MGLLDFIFRKKKEHSPKIVLQKYSPLEPYSTPRSPEFDNKSREVQKLSSQYYRAHCNNISSFDYRFLQNINEKELSCVEKRFLKYVCGRRVHNTYIAGYWSHTYGINYCAVMSKFFKLGLLKADIDLQDCTVKTLKDILRKRGFPISGKKDNLIARIGGTDSLSPQEVALLEDYRAYIPTERGNVIINTLQETENDAGSCYSFQEMKVLFTKEEVDQHEKFFFDYLKEALQKEKLIVQVKELHSGWRFLWHDCQVGQIEFSEYGHYMQWIIGASVPNYENILQIGEEDINKYIHATCGDVVSAEGLTLQDCIDKIPYWIQYIHVLVEDEEI